ncbi:MAG: methyltransferase domain-containing protein [Candidatus Magasanikbacteria bacterium]|nr:methyltransferase domain-containing protein [Candidatus Magasanikbacteria bacterium]
MQYIFILGREPELSTAEIFSLFKRLKIEYRVSFFQKENLILDVIEKIDLAKIMAQLGGTVKIAEVKKQLGKIEMIDFKKEILNLIKDKATDRKIFFGISAYIGKFPTLGLEIKKELSDQDIKARFVSSREKVLSSVVVKTNKLLNENGVEIIIAGDKNQIWLGQTLAIQPFAEFSERDYGRPGRDKFSGMLPPKLAKIMINLAEISTDAVILDPFCGSGTILTEAMLMGYTNVLGSDNSDKAIADAQKNIDWLKLKNCKLTKCNAILLSKCFLANSIDAIITEPFLGPPLRNRETKKNLQKIVNELTQLYCASLNEFAKILKPNGVIIMIWPILQQKIFLSLLEKLAAMNLRIEPLLSPDFQQFKTPRQTLIYARPDQKVGREIVKIKRPR